MVYLYKMYIFSYNTMKLQQVFIILCWNKLKNSYCPVLPVSGIIAQPGTTRVCPPSKTRPGITLPTLVSTILSINHPWSYPHQSLGFVIPLNSTMSGQQLETVKYSNPKHQANTELFLIHFYVLEFNCKDYIALTSLNLRICINRIRITLLKE